MKVGIFNRTFITSGRNKWHLKIFKDKIGMPAKQINKKALYCQQIINACIYQLAQITQWDNAYTMHYNQFLCWLDEVWYPTSLKPSIAHKILAALCMPWAFPARKLGTVLAEWKVVLPTEKWAENLRLIFRQVPFVCGGWAVKVHETGTVNIPVDESRK